MELRLVLTLFRVRDGTVQDVKADVPGFDGNASVRNAIDKNKRREEFTLVGHIVNECVLLDGDVQNRGYC